jgi:hypothetical protein
MSDRHVRRALHLRAPPSCLRRLPRCPLCAWALPARSAAAGSWLTRTPQRTSAPTLRGGCPAGKPASTGAGRACGGRQQRQCSSARRRLRCEPEALALCAHVRRARSACSRAHVRGGALGQSGQAGQDPAAGACVCCMTCCARAVPRCFPHGLFLPTRATHARRTATAPASVPRSSPRKVDGARSPPRSPLPDVSGCWACVARRRRGRHARAERHSHQGVYPRHSRRVRHE